MNRLQFSLAFNYLNVLFHSPNKEDFPDTAFLHSVGAKMSLSILDWFLPLLMVLLYIACKLKFFDIVMRRLGYEEAGDPIVGNTEHEAAIFSGKSLVIRGRSTLGLGEDEGGGGEEERARASELARNKRAIVMARMEARRAGKDPDSVARLDGLELTTEAKTSAGGEVGESLAVASLGSLSSFSSAGGGVADGFSEGLDKDSSTTTLKSATSNNVVNFSGLLGLGALAAKRYGSVVSGTSSGEDKGNGGFQSGDSSRVSLEVPKTPFRSPGAIYNDEPPLASFVPEPPSLANLLKGKRATPASHLGATQAGGRGAVGGAAGQGFVAPRPEGGLTRSALSTL